MSNCASHVIQDLLQHLLIKSGVVGFEPHLENCVVVGVLLFDRLNRFDELNILDDTENQQFHQTVHVHIFKVSWWLFECETEDL